jgi:RNA polymerase sigma factor (sigma-70 family)
MATPVLDDILRHLRRAVRRPEDDDSDTRLLERFLRQRDHAAFESLVLRHGPMVLGVCRRVLANAHDAEDAFQATFLVLVRKAASIRKRGTLGTWLYGVAHRTALAARRAMARRRAKEAAAPPRAEAPAEPVDDLREVLDRELAALPEPYREVVVLCDLEGKGRKEVARELGCPEGTVASRLARGRSLLAKRLARYGLATGAVAMAGEAASACVPAALVSATVRAAARFAAGRAAGAVSANVSFLVERGVRTMLVMRLRALTAVMLVVGVVASGAGWLYYQGTAAAQPDAPDPGAVRRGEGDRADPEKLRRELALLKADLRRATERAAALEAKLKGMEEAPQEVLYRGKPARFWIKELKDADPECRKEAARALGEISEVDGTVIPALLGALRDRRDQVREEAHSALQIAGTAALPHLVTALKAPSQRDRMWVIYTLSSFGPRAQAAVPALTDLLHAPDKTDRLLAAKTLGRIGPEARAAVPSLIALLKDNEPVTFPFDRALYPLFRVEDYTYVPCRTAAAALGGIGPDARAALPALREVQQVLDGGARAVIRDAIQKIDPRAARDKK